MEKTITVRFHRNHCKRSIRNSRPTSRQTIRNGQRKTHKQRSIYVQTIERAHVRDTSNPQGHPHQRKSNTTTFFSDRKQHKHDRTHIQSNSEKHYREQKLSMVYQQVQTLLSMARAETIQRNIIDIITDSSHGKLNPVIFPVVTAQEQLTLIRTHLSTELSVPGEDGIKELYSSMKIRTTTYDAMVLFEMKIPLYNSKRFQLYRSLAVPTPVNNSFMSIQPATDYLIINRQRDIYYPLNEIELLRCVKRQDNSFACQLKHPLYKPASGKNTCELNLLKHRGMTDCRIKKQPLTSLWTQLTSTNKWLYSTTHPITIDIICDDEVHSQQLMGSGQIQFFDQCKIERDDIMIQTTKIFTSIVNTSFIPSFSLTEALNTTETTPTLRITKFDKTNANLDELDTTIKALQNEMNNPPANVHDLHHYCINYTTIICIIIAASIYIYKKGRTVLPKLNIATRSNAANNASAEAAECSNNTLT